MKSFTIFNSDNKKNATFSASFSSYILVEEGSKLYGDSYKERTCTI